jgi:hypothetical protein
MSRLGHSLGSCRVGVWATRLRRSSSGIRPLGFRGRVSQTGPPKVDGDHDVRPAVFCSGPVRTGSWIVRGAAMRPPSGHRARRWQALSLGVSQSERTSRRMRHHAPRRLPPSSPVLSASTTKTAALIRNTSAWSRRTARPFSGSFQARPGESSVLSRTEPPAYAFAGIPRSPKTLSPHPVTGPPRAAPAVLIDGATQLILNPMPGEVDDSGILLIPGTGPREAVDR